ncbi:hypothetical protein [Kitasatospora sp. NPDC001547]|uniref:hypothetical protein n=1 Tax=Kitasatospora sp. NPDC001547 TaxID=3364015 RepID=UPI00369C4FC4
MVVTEGGAGGSAHTPARSGTSATATTSSAPWPKAAAAGGLRTAGTIRASSATVSSSHQDSMAPDAGPR